MNQHWQTGRELGEETREGGEDMPALCGGSRTSCFCGQGVGGDLAALGLGRDHCANIQVPPTSSLLVSVGRDKGCLEPFIIPPSQQPE